MDMNKISDAREAVRKWGAYGKHYFLHIPLSFRINELNRYIGAQFNDTFTELSVKAGRTEEVFFKIPQEVPKQVGWELMVAKHSLNFRVEFRPESGGEWKELAKADQRDSEEGPLFGNFQPEGPGVLRLVFDNGYSFLRGKTAFYSVDPELTRVSSG